MAAMRKQKLAIKCKIDVPKDTVLGQLQSGFEFTIPNIDSNNDDLRQILTSNKSIETIKLPLKPLACGLIINLYKVCPIGLNGIDTGLSESDIAFWDITQVDKAQDANVCYFCCYVNHWPEVFIYTKEDIKKGEDLCVYRDPNVWTTLQCKNLTNLI